LSSSPADRYRARFRAVLEFIDAHLDEPLDLERLSAVASFSKFHFQRQFTEWFGLGVAKYVQLARLKRASYRLAFREDESVLSIAYASGYEAPEAFARAYKKTLRQTPSDFRKDPNWSSWYAAYDPLRKLRSNHMNDSIDIEQVRIVDFAGATVATLEHRGDARRIGDSIRTFIEWRKQSGLHPSTSATYNILYDDPMAVAPDDYRFDLCAATDRPVPPNAHGIVTKSIPPGRCAVLRITGGDDALACGVRFLYSQWLPQSGEELRDFPLFLQRVHFFPDVPEHQQLVELFLPLT
jgi:AraC family transcriptional regulator